MSRSHQHRFSTHRAAWKIILLVSSLWVALCVHYLVFYDIQLSANGASRSCTSPTGAYAIFLSFNAIIVNGLSMPFLMTLFGLLTVRNLKRHRQQVHGSGPTVGRRQKHEWAILRMLLLQTIVNVALSLPITIYLCYSGFTQYVSKSSNQVFIENYVYNMLTVLQNINAAVSFSAVNTRQS